MGIYINKQNIWYDFNFLAYQISKDVENQALSKTPPVGILISITYTEGILATCTKITGV